MIDIVIIDSGLGGVSLLSRLTQTFCFKNYLYFADNKNLPYGLKTKKELILITIKNMKKIIKKYKPKLIVFGCNTIGTTIIEDIKKIFNNQNIFGIRPILQDVNFKNNKTLLLATNRTIDYFKKNKNNLKSNKNIILCKMSLLANKVENNIQNLDNIVPYLKSKLQRYYQIKNIFLGCTHYYFIKNQLKYLFPKAKIKDGGDYLINDIKTFVCKNLFLFKNVKNRKKVKVKVILTKKSYQIKVYKKLISKEILN